MNLIYFVILYIEIFDEHLLLGFFYFSSLDLTEKSKLDSIMLNYFTGVGLPDFKSNVIYLFVFSAFKLVLILSGDSLSF